MLHALCGEYWEALLRHNPTYATFLGDRRHNDRLPDLSDDGREAWRKEAAGFLDRLSKIDVASLSDTDRVTADILRRQLEESIEEARHKFHQWAVDQMDGPQADFPALMNFHPPDDEAGLVARFTAFPKLIDQYLGNLRAGVAEERVASRIAVERVIGQLKDLLAKGPEKSPFATKESYVAPVRDHVWPAYRKMLEYLEGTYLAKARVGNVGLWALPGGEEAYAYRCAVHTTTSHSPEELHRVGREEVGAIQEEMREIAKGELKSFMKTLMETPRHRFASREDLLGEARRQVERAYAKLPEYFGKLPKTPCAVRPVEDYREKDAPAAFYYPPDEQLTREGRFYANTYKPETRPRFNMPALAYHEAVPGHHLQIALAMEMEGMPQVRKHAGFNAYIEGWGLYSERLAVEMGLYEDDLARFGMLTFQAWRAARLVVDTGIHALRWTREDALRYLYETVTLPQTEVENEVDRYIIWPGQALSYMTGMREIRALRREAEEAMGDRFDLRGFHDRVLGQGALPLSTLAELVRGWMTSGTNQPG